MKPNPRFMELAIEEALKAKERGDYAIGAVVIKNGKVIASGGNRVKTKNDSSRHVEMEVLQYTKGMIRERYLDGYELYSTHEPCMMCLGACWWLGIRRIYYGISQKELEEYGRKHGTENLRYRPTPIPTAALIEFFELPVRMEQFMNKECIKKLQ